MASVGTAKLLANDDLGRLVVHAAENRISNLNYAGEVSPSGAFGYLSNNSGVLVDVRTAPEWQFIGTPNLSDTPSRLLLLSWKLYPSFIENPRFIGDLIAETSIDVDTPLFFICRSGGRSLDAAIAATAEGYKYCFNITGGFEGEIDKNGHRGMVHGWKYEQLPWVQG